jgi:hypothetical protein
MMMTDKQKDDLIFTEKFEDDPVLEINSKRPDVEFFWTKFFYS